MNWQSIAGQLAQSGAPILGGILGGPAGGIVGNLVGSLVGSALGVPATPEAVDAAIKADPAGAAAKLQPIEAQVRDLESARSQTVELAKTGSRIAWGAPAVSVIGMGGFVGLSLLAALHGLPSSEVMTMIVSTFRDVTIYVVSYWLGSSFGSRSKDDTITTAVNHIAAAASNVIPRRAG